MEIKRKKHILTNKTHNPIVAYIIEQLGPSVTILTEIDEDGEEEFAGMELESGYTNNLVVSSLDWSRVYSVEMDDDHLIVNVVHEYEHHSAYCATKSNIYIINDVFINDLDAKMIGTLQQFVDINGETDNEV